MSHPTDDTHAAHAAHDDHEAHDDHHDHDDHEAHGVGHVVPPKILIATGGALMVLTVLTVAVSRVDFAEWDLPEINIWIAMSIAIAKASLVCLFFMHLRWDRGFNAIVLLGSAGFVGIFMAFALIDTLEYRNDLIQGDTPTVQNLLAEFEGGTGSAGAGGGEGDGGDGAEGGEGAEGGDGAEGAGAAHDAGN